jgi:OOP family OmpA-OmpF porin
MTAHAQPKYSNLDYTVSSIWIAMLLVMLFISGCGASSISQLREVTPQGTPFTVSLTEEYRKFVVYEMDEMYDWPDAKHFAKKGLQVSRGVNEPPEQLAIWNLPEKALSELKAARARLITLLGAGARKNSPKRTAKAQAGFDCWVEQQEENWQTEHIAACRNAYYSAIYDVEKKLAPYAVIPFEHDSVDVFLLGEAPFKKLIRDLQIFEDVSIVINGHADRSGPDKYNHELSLARSLSVWKILVAEGISPKRIAIQASGEQSPLVATDNGIREPLNRRAEVIVHLKTRAKIPQPSPEVANQGMVR